MELEMIEQNKLWSSAIPAFNLFSLDLSKGMQTGE